MTAARPAILKPAYHMDEPWIHIQGSLQVAPLPRVHRQARFEVLALAFEFVNMIVDYLTENGAMNPALLYSSPYTDFSPLGVDGLFESPKLPRSCPSSDPSPGRRLRRAAARLTATDSSSLLAFPRPARFPRRIECPPRRERLEQRNEKRQE